MGCIRKSHGVSPPGKALCLSPEGILSIDIIRLNQVQVDQNIIKQDNINTYNINSSDKVIYDKDDSKNICYWSVSQYQRIRPDI